MTEIISKTKKTHLYEEHLQLRAKIVEFAGWSMPIQYKGLREEHQQVRNHVGIFDVSHMGEIRVVGREALNALEWLTTNHVSKLEAGQAQYSLFPNDKGGVVDDLIVYCLKPKQEYLLCVNASNKDKDFQWLLQNNRYNDAKFIDESDVYSQIAIQGPKSGDLIRKVIDLSLEKTAPFQLISSSYHDHPIMIATTGYTGEKGCEIFVPNEGVRSLWRDLLEKGQEFGVEPIGLGARDTLRTEMKYPLYGHEIDDTTNPYEAGLAWVIKPKDKQYLGMEKMESIHREGLKKKLVGFKMLEKGIPRQGYTLFSFDNLEVGRVTSGTVSPTLDEPIGIGYIAVEQNPREGYEFFVDIRGRKVRAKVCKTPFVSPHTN